MALPPAEKIDVFQPSFYFPRRTEHHALFEVCAELCMARWSA
jgi:hypothetical protein